MLFRGGDAVLLSMITGAGWLNWPAFLAGIPIKHDLVQPGFNQGSGSHLLEDGGCRLVHQQEQAHQGAE